MLLYKNGRFHCGKASFALPNNCFFLTEEQETSYPFGVSLTDSAESYTLVAYFSHNDDDPQTSLSEIIASITHTPCELSPYDKNGLSGYYAKYHDTQNFYLEFALEADTQIEDEDEEPVNTLSIVVHASNGEVIKKAMSDPLIWELLDSVQIAK